MHGVWQPYLTVSRSAFPTSTAGDQQILARGSLCEQSRLHVLPAAKPASQAAILGWTLCKGFLAHGAPQMGWKISI